MWEFTARRGPGGPRTAEASGPRRGKKKHKDISSKRTRKAPRSFVKPRSFIKHARIPLAHPPPSHSLQGIRTPLPTTPSRLPSPPTPHVLAVPAPPKCYGSIGICCYITGVGAGYLPPRCYDSVRVCCRSAGMGAMPPGGGIGVGAVGWWAGGVRRAKNVTKSSAQAT
jgi:hypothetical protein